MTPTTLSEHTSRTPGPHTPRTPRPHTPRVACSRSRQGRSRAHTGSGSSLALARYTDSLGRLREILARPGRGGTVLVVDRDATTLGDRRLVAHLAADEPAENARVVCGQYLCDPGGRRCRPLGPDDLVTIPFRFDPAAHAARSRERGVGAVCTPRSTAPSAPAGLLDRHGFEHRLVPLDAGMSIPELRWCRRPTEPHGCPRVPVEPESVRDAVGGLEEYEPVRALTARALELHVGDPALSVAVLGAELRRLDASRIVLNRGLRRAVERAMRVEGMSLSEIAFRCGRVKRDSRGRASGETSWLARRVGLAPEGGGEGAPTPWIHSEVLALIAREGLGISPREVEL